MSSCEDSRVKFKGFPSIDKKLVAVGRRLRVISFTLPIGSGTPYAAASWKVEVVCSDRNRVARDRSVAIEETDGILPNLTHIAQGKVINRGAPQTSRGSGGTDKQCKQASSFPSFPNLPC